MSFDSSIKQMLNSYPDTMPQIDKLREILQQTALLALARHQLTGYLSLLESKCSDLERFL